MKILFIGGTKRGYLSLKHILESANQVVGVISLEQDTHEVEHYEESIKDLAEKYGIPHFQTRWMRDQDYVQILSQRLKPDVAFVVGCRIIISKEIYQVPPLGTLAFHDSYLPEYRGFAPLNWSIINGEDHTGVSIFYLSEFMDGGDILAKKKVAIGPHDTAPQVYERVCQATIDLIGQACVLLQKGEIRPEKQNYSLGSFTCSRTPADGMIEWKQPAIKIYNQVRALTYPYPGAYSYYKREKLTVWIAKPVENPPNYVGRIPGRIVQVSKEEGFVDVLTGDGILRICDVQVNGKERTVAADVIGSVRSSLGIDTEYLLRRVNFLEQEMAKLKKIPNHV